MIRLIIVTLLLGQILYAHAQTGSILHHGTFRKTKIGLSSKPYKPDGWEKPYLDSCLKTAFPSDLLKSPEKYKGRCIHLIGIVDSVTVDEHNRVTFVLDNKYWDYVEDYGMQDEVMFVSDNGDGRFAVTVPDISPAQLEEVKRFAAEKKLFLVYGTFSEIANDYPVIAAAHIKYIDYLLYTTKVFSYDILRNENVEVAANKEGKVQTTNLKFLKVAGKGQNK